jgi:hypothetical protein
MPEPRTVPNHQQPVVELTSKFDSAVSNFSDGTKALKVISASEAFRKYNWLRDAAVVNASGNLRGMVVSRNWKVVFEQSLQAAEILEKVGTVAAFAANIAEQSEDVSTVLQSTEDTTMKGLKLASIAGTAAERTLAGMVTGTVSTALFSMQGYCQMIGLVNENARSFANRCTKFLRETDGRIQTTVRTWTNTNKQAEAIYWVTSKIVFTR